MDQTIYERLRYPTAVKIAIGGRKSKNPASEKTYLQEKSPKLRTAAGKKRENLKNVVKELYCLKISKQDLHANNSFL